MKTRTALGWMLALTSAAAMTACGGNVSKGGGEERTGIGRAALKRAQSCDDLLSMLQADAIAKENFRIDAMLAELRRYGSHGNPKGIPTATDDFLDDSAGAPSRDPDMGAGEGGDGNEAPGSGSSGASDYSRTNTQVDGVDEADIVKTDGKRIYLVHGQRFFILDAWPAANLSEASSVEIEGEPTEIFVEGGRALVYSNVNGDPIYEAAGVEARGQYGYGYVDGFGPGDASQPSPGMGAAEPGFDPGGSGADRPGGIDGSKPGYGRTRLLKITVLELEGTTPKVEAEHWFEGDYRSSRRMGAKVRTVLQGGDHGPTLAHFPTNLSSRESLAEYEAALEGLRRENIARISQTKVLDWLPYELTREGGRIVANTPACESFYAPTAATTEMGLVQVKSLDWTAPAKISGVSIVGGVDNVYANESSMYLAATAWRSGYLYEALLAVPGDQPISVAANRTHVHKLDLTANPDEPVYVASGTVTGSVLDQFSMDERAGRLRIATTEDRVTLGGSSGNSGGGGVSVDVGEGPVQSEPGNGGSDVGFAEDAGSAEPMPPPTPPPSEKIGKQSSALASLPSRVNRLFVLEPQGEELVAIGDVGELAPNERIYSARFVGDKGYVVTFRQVDPLFVIDLSNPAKPTVLGELEIPGFSNYMHPIDDGHLLTIGQDAGVTNGLAVQLFDVSVPTSPQLKSKYVFSAAWGSSEAQHNHKAFTWYPSRKLLAFPYIGYDPNMGARSSLELISVDVQAGASAVSPYGSIDHSSFFQNVPGGYCGGYYGIGVRRGLFLDDVVFSISYGGVMAHELSDLGAPIASLPLSAPSSSYYGCGWEG